MFNMNITDFMSAEESKTELQKRAIIILLSNLNPFKGLSNTTTPGVHIRLVSAPPTG